ASSTLRAHTAGGSFSGSRQKVFLEPVDRARYLDLLQRACGIDRLRTDLRAGADERAIPDTGMAGDDFLALVAAAIARVEVVAVRQRDRGRTEEHRLQRVFGAG